MSDQPRILVTGATGAVGPRIVSALSDAGYQIRTLSFDHPPAGFRPRGIDARIGDVTNPAVVRAAMEGMDAVVHLAALLHIVNPPPELQGEYRRVNVGGTAAVVEAALNRQVRRLVFFSTIAVYGPSGGQILREDSPTRPETFYAQTKLDAEQVVLAARRKDGRPLGVVLRLGAVYGSRIKGNYRRLLLSLARRRFIPIGPGRNRRTLVYDRDVARACLLALSHPDVPGGIFNVTDGQMPAMKQIIGVLCTALGRREPRLTLPAGMVRGMAAGIDNGSRVLGMRSLSLRATVDKYGEDVAVDGGCFCRTTGFVPQYDLLSGWKETVAEMKLAGEL